jgi:hypothetical protein
MSGCAPRSHDRALPRIGIEALGGITFVPEINASSGLIISIKIVFPDKPRDAARGGLIVLCEMAWRDIRGQA